MADDRMRFAGDSWALGFWSALNLLDTGNHAVGDPADTSVALNDIHARCRRSPGMALRQIVTEAYAAAIGRTTIVR